MSSFLKAAYQDNTVSILDCTDKIVTIENGMDLNDELDCYMNWFNDESKKLASIEWFVPFMVIVANNFSILDLESKLEYFEIKHYFKANLDSDIDYFYTDDNKNDLIYIFIEDCQMIQLESIAREYKQFIYTGQFPDGFYLSDWS